MDNLFLFSSADKAVIAYNKIRDLFKANGHLTVEEFRSIADIGYEIGPDTVNDCDKGWFNINDIRIFENEPGADKSYGIFSDPVEFMKNTNDSVSHPIHYQSETGLEVISVIEAFTSDLKGIEATDTGNILKYMCRWKKKNGLEDLKKARWYLEHLIAHIEKIEKES